MAKKEFKRVNPAEAFITIPEEDALEGKSLTEESVKEIAKETERIITPTIVPDGYKLNPKFIETKSKKVQLLLQPSVVESVKTFARQNGISMNEAINQAIQEYVARYMENGINL